MVWRAKDFETREESEIFLAPRHELVGEGYAIDSGGVLFFNQ